MDSKIHLRVSGENRFSMELQPEQRRTGETAADFYRNGYGWCRHPLHTGLDTEYLGTAFMALVSDLAKKSKIHESSGLSLR